MTDSIEIKVDADIFDLATAFIDNRRKDTERIRNAMAAKDWPFLHRIGHELKGTAGSYGFRELSSIGQVLEAAAVARDTATATPAVARMLDYLQRLCVLPLDPREP